MGSIVYDACLSEKKSDEENVRFAQYRNESFDHLKPFIETMIEEHKPLLLTRKMIMDDLAVKDEALFGGCPFVSDSGDETPPKIGAYFRIRFPEGYTVIDGHPLGLSDAIKATKDYETVFGRPSEPEEPAFMVYQASTDEMVPLTQERLRDLVEHEKQFFRLRHHLRDVADDPVTMCR